jgi:hypothetical protein
MQKCQSFANPINGTMPAPKKAPLRRRTIDDEEEDFDDDSEEENAAKAAEGKPKSAAKPASDVNARAGDEFYSVGAYGKKTPKLAELASLACSNSVLVGKKIE